MEIPGGHRACRLLIKSKQRLKKLSHPRALFTMKKQASTTTATHSCTTTLRLDCTTTVLRGRGTDMMKHSTNT